LGLSIKISTFLKLVEGGRLDLAWWNLDSLLLSTPIGQASVAHFKYIYINLNIVYFGEEKNQDGGEHRNASLGNAE